MIGPDLPRACFKSGPALGLPTLPGCSHARAAAQWRIGLQHSGAQVELQWQMDCVTAAHGLEQGRRFSRHMPAPMC